MKKSADVVISLHPIRNPTTITLIQRIIRETAKRTPPKINFNHRFFRLPRRRGCRNNRSNTATKGQADPIHRSTTTTLSFSLCFKAVGVFVRRQQSHSSHGAVSPPLLILKIEFGLLNVCFRWTRVEPGQWAFDHPHLRYYIPVHTPRLRGKNMINHILHFSIRKKGNKIEERPDKIDRWRKLRFSFSLLFSVLFCNTYHSAVYCT